MHDSWDTEQSTNSVEAQAPYEDGPVAVMP